MTTTSTCDGCGTSLYIDDTHCAACGKPRSGYVPPSVPTSGATRVFAALAEAGTGEVPTCPLCGGARLADDAYCANCGGRVTGSTPSAATQPEADGWAEVRRDLEKATQGEFEVVGELGRGGMAVIYRAKDLALDRDVAIKVMAPGLLMGKGMVERFRQEAVTVANLHHPNIVTIHTVRQAGRLHFFVMQLIEGQSLEAVLRRPDPIPVALAQVILYQLGNGLAYAHRHNVVHRDIKPANVLMDGDGNAILTDFGIAKVTTKANLTQTGSTMGTPSYMSPEQCLAGELSGASDQYSLGIMAYEMLAGQPPFTGTSFAIMQGHTATPAPPFLDKRPDCPPELEAAVLQMLEKDPAARFQSVAEAVEAIGGYVPGPGDPLRLELARLGHPGEEGTPIGPSTLQPLPTKPPTAARISGASAAVSKPRSRAPLVVGSIVGLGVIGAAVVFGLQAMGSSTSEPLDLPTATPTLASIVLPASGTTLLVGQVDTVRADLQDSNGLPVTDETVAWTSDAPSIASVAGLGEQVVITALAPGSANVRASAAGLQSTFSVSVSAPGAGSLTVSPRSRELIIGDEVRLRAAVTDPTGQTDGTATVTWRSGDSNIVSVDGSGLATAMGAGSTRITASAGDRTNGSNIRVLAGRVAAISVAPPQGPLEPGDQVVLHSTVTSRPAGYLGTRGILWASSNPSVAAIAFSDADSAVVTLVAAGGAQLTVQTDTIQTVLNLTVAAAVPVVTVSLTPESVAFTAEEGGAEPDPQTVSVAATGGSTPSVGLVQYDGATSNWLEPRLQSASVLSLTANVSGLAAGTYSATVPIMAGDAARDLSVRFTVAPRAAIAANAQAGREIQDMLVSYLDALKSGDMSQVRRYYPAADAGDLEAVTQSLRRDDRYFIQLLPGTLKLGRQDDTLEGEVMIGVVGGDQGANAGLVYSFGRGAQGWYVVSLGAN